MKQNATTTHGLAVPGAGTSSRQRRVEDHGAPWAGQWLRDQLDRIETQNSIARIQRKMQFNEECV